MALFKTLMNFSSHPQGFLDRSLLHNRAHKTAMDLILLKGSLTCTGHWLQASPNRMALSELPKAAQGQGQPHWESWEIRSACTHTEEETRMLTHAKICRVKSCSSGIFHQEFPQKKKAAAFSRSNQRALQSVDFGWLSEIQRHLFHLTPPVLMRQCCMFHQQLPMLTCFVPYRAPFSSAPAKALFGGLSHIWNCLLFSICFWPAKSGLSKVPFNLASGLNDKTRVCHRTAFPIHLNEMTTDYSVGRSTLC